MFSMEEKIEVVVSYKLKCPHCNQDVSFGCIEHGKKHSIKKTK